MGPRPSGRAGQRRKLAAGWRARPVIGGARDKPQPGRAQNATRRSPSGKPQRSSRCRVVLGCGERQRARGEGKHVHPVHSRPSLGCTGGPVLVLHHGVRVQMALRAATDGALALATAVCA